MWTRILVCIWKEIVTIEFDRQTDIHWLRVRRHVNVPYKWVHLIEFPTTWMYMNYIICKGACINVQGVCVGGGGSKFNAVWWLCIPSYRLFYSNHYMGETSVTISGPVNTLLSWSAIIPLSRLTYCAYLVHPIVMYTYYFSRRTLMYWYDLDMVSSIKPII